MSSTEPTNSLYEPPVDDLIVPEHVTRGYLAGYDTNFLATLENVYDRIEKAQLSQITDVPNPGASLFVLVAGSQGVGKSNLVRSLQADPEKGQYIVCDVDAILLQIPGAENALNDANKKMLGDYYRGEAYSTKTHYNEVNGALEYYRHAAKYISDRLMTMAVRNGFNVIVETNARTPHIGSFLANIKNSGAILESHICEAPLSVKLRGANIEGLGYSFPPDVIKSDHQKMRDNLSRLVAACDDNVTIWWRQDHLAPLKAAAVRVDGHYTVDPVAMAGFEGHFADNGGHTIVSLLGANKAAAEPRIAGPEVTL